MIQKYVLMVVPSDFPEGDAGAVRDLSFAKIYNQLGFEVFLIGRGRNNAEGNYCGIHFFSVYSEANSFFSKIKRQYLQYRKYKKNVEDLIAQYGFPSIIHINHLQESVFKFLYQMSKENNILMFHDSTEWYSKSEFTLGRFDKAYIIKDRWNRKILKRPVKIIAISSYLEKYFFNRGFETIRIPVIMDVGEFQYKSSKILHDKISVVYAGSPAKKDYLKEIVLAVDSLSEIEKSKIDFHIYGVDRYFIESILQKNNISECFKIYGRVKRDVVKKALNTADFSVLLRPENERYTKAGFPTKVVEAMMSNTAMLCNITSDLGMYLRNYENAILVEECTVSSFLKGLRYILSLRRDEIEIIKKNARMTAELKFDYRLYVEKIRLLINN